VLKNAIDSVFATFAFRGKPAACVAYSGGIGGGIRAIEHLAHVAIEAEMVPLRNNVVITFAGDAFSTDVQPTDPRTGAAAKILLDDLPDGRRRCGRPGHGERCRRRPCA